jgi:predicted Zn-dependent protease
MAPLPKAFSVKANAISMAISEGRTEEAMQKLIDALVAPQDDRAVRNLAAEWIAKIGLPGGAAKKLRGGHPELLEDWLLISEMVQDLKSRMTYAAATAEAAAHFKCSERHVQKCVAEWNRVNAEFG